MRNSNLSTSATQAPMIADLKAQGLAGACPVCRACGHSGAATFDAIGLPGLERSIPRQSIHEH